MRPTTEDRRALLAALVEAEGFPSAVSLLESCVHDSVCPGICVNPGCGYVVEIEPDSREGWCEECCENTVWSALVLAGLI